MTTTSSSQPASPATGTIATSATREGRGLRFWILTATASLATVIVLTAGVTAWWVQRQLNPPPITPVVLTQPEEKVLEAKVETLSNYAAERHGEPPPRATSAGREPRETVSTSRDRQPPRRTVSITERELNAVLGRNTGLADRVAIELVHDAIRARTNIPLPDDLPLFGGRTARVDVSLETRLVDQRLSMRVADVSVAGFPVPNAWLGGLKDIDLVERYGQTGAMRALVAGIERFEIADGVLYLTPAE